MRLPGHTRTRAALAATASAALLLGVPAVSGATTPDTALVPHSHFVMQADGSSGLTARGDAIPNIDSVKSTIRAYYGATSAGIANKTDSPYITEMHAIENAILAGLPATPPVPHSAVVFDADDTMLWTYDMEDGAMHFNFDPALQNTWVQNKMFPATPGMVDLVNEVANRGYDVYGITGRTNDQETATLANLSEKGYTPFNADNFFTKWTAQAGGTALPQPDYVNCAADSDPAKCSTVEYKAATRKHIEDSGETIVLNVGDQFSDLQGGYSMRVAKLPNPTYYLPSLDLTTPGPGEAAGSPRTEFTMKADGSSGATEGGEGIPNIDSVKSTIRNYYGATDPAQPGIANKTASPYIDQMTKFSKTWTHRLAVTCARVAKRGEKPAVVFDADDTTLWTYDMEDGAMKFNFNPTLQNDEWVMKEKFIPVPGMQRVVRAAATHGCTVVGITGRRKAQRAATIDNLNNFYDDVFKTKYYFTKWDKGGEIPAYVTCAATNPDCTTIEYKSQTRKHVQDDLGLRIVANLGDQYSDLLGGSSDRAVKLPNPTYYLP